MNHPTEESLYETILEIIASEIEPFVAQDLSVARTARLLTDKALRVARGEDPDEVPEDEDDTLGFWCDFEDFST